MKSGKLVDIFSCGNIVIPLYMFKNYKKLNVNLEEFIFLMYLYNEPKGFIFNPSLISNNLNIPLNDVMMHISSLEEKHLLAVETIKNDKGLLEEIINISSFYEKLSLIVTGDVVENDNSDSNIFEMVEQEFGRTLSPIEYEIIKAWLDASISEELITEALKEATFNGVSNLRYIDKILFEWGKLGLKNKEDVLKNKKKHRKEKDKEELTEIFDYDWFDDDE